MKHEDRERFDSYEDGNEPDFVVTSSITQIDAESMF